MGQSEGEEPFGQKPGASLVFIEVTVAAGWGCWACWGLRNSAHVHRGLPGAVLLPVCYCTARSCAAAA